MGLPSLIKYFKKFLDPQNKGLISVNVVNVMSSGFIGSNVDVGESSGIVRDEAFVLTFQGLKVQKHVCEDGVWRIERCPPLLNIHGFAIQKLSMKHCNTIIIARKVVHGIPSPCYNGLWSNFCTSFSFVQMI
jgi:hypothetical protein